MNNCIELPAGVSKREGLKNIPFPVGDPERIIVSLIEFQDRIYVATQKDIYRIEEDKLTRLEIDAKDTNI